MKKLGIAWIKVDGAMLETMQGARLNLGGATREPVVGNNQVLGYAERPVEATLECEIAVGPGTSLEDLRQIRDATITFEADTGQTYALRNAWLREPPEVTDGEGGRVPLRFAARAAEEVS